MDGEQGWQIIESTHPDLILCDIQLPTLSGYELIKRLKQDSALNQIPIIAVTAFAMVGDKEKMYQAGFNGYLAKPIDPETFVATLETYLPAQSLIAINQQQQNQSLASSQPWVKPSAEDQGLILVVDDNPQVLELVRTLLESANYQVLSTTHASMAFNLIKQYAIDLLITDLNMPEMNGLELITQVRNMKTNQPQAIILLTSVSATEHATIHPEALGIYSIIRLPIEPHVFLKAINQCLAKVKH
jgi:two-component system cell cycle response regulator